MDALPPQEKTDPSIVAGGWGDACLGSRCIRFAWWPIAYFYQENLAGNVKFIFQPAGK